MSARQYIELHNASRRLYEAALAMLQEAHSDDIELPNRDAVAQALETLKPVVGNEWDEVPHA